MSSWSKHTKANTNGIGDYELKKEDYIKPAEMLAKYGEDVKILGGYINGKSKMGAHPVIFVDTKDGVKGLDLNQSYTEQWKAIFADPDDRDTIESGKASGKLVKCFSDTYKKEFVAFQI